MNMKEEEMVKTSREIYEMSCVLWNELSPERDRVGGSPGVPFSYNVQLGYIEAAINALEGVKEGLMEKEFPMLKKVREAQNKFWEKKFPGLK